MVGLFCTLHLNLHYSEFHSRFDKNLERDTPPPLLNYILKIKSQNDMDFWAKIYGCPNKKKNIPKIFKDKVKTNWYALAKTFNEHKDLKM